jgi:hypothetical protein
MTQQQIFVMLNSAENRSNCSPCRAFLRSRHPLRGLQFIMALLVSTSVGAVQAQVKLDVSYGVTLAGVKIGVVASSLEIERNRYRVTATGATSGLLQIFASGHGEMTASGVRSRGELLPSAYASSIVIRGRNENVRIGFVDELAKEISVDPVPAPNDALLPITDANRKRVVDPLTAALVTLRDTGSQLGPDVCQRAASVFDGQLRYDLKLAFKQLANVTTAVGYQGNAVVCSVSFLPIAGHDPNRFLFKYLAEQRDIELWLVPVAGAGIVVPYRVSIRTPMGLGVMQADRFVLESAPVPASVH